MRQQSYREDVVRRGVDGPTAAGLHVDITSTGDREVEVVVSGELDLCTSPTLHDHVTGLERAKTTVVLDLSGVAFMDSTGLRALWTIRQQVAAAGGTLLLRSPSDAVSRVLHITKLDGVFEFVSRDGDEPESSP